MAGFLKKILWATDFSDEAQESLLYADAFAKAFKASIVALHVIPDFSAALYDAAYVIKGELVKKVAAVKKDAEEKLKTLQKAKGITFKNIVKEGTAAKVIIEVAEKEGVDLIVIGRRGMSAIEKLFIGSVANQVLRNSPVPILLTKKKTGVPRFKKLIVPTDFSEREEVERDFAWAIAKGFGAELTLLHVLELHDYEFSPRVLDDMMDSLLKRLKQRKKREKTDIKIREEVYRAINAAIGIVDYAETHNYDLIVISTCVQSKLERFFLGSTTEKVISYTHIPVFAIPPTYCLA
ncbi:MAG: universal stress protein [Candidatus Aminicenantes bacterium]|nr:universal stress protein [Candidatus Aminicenantes bacterium]